MIYQAGWEWYLRYQAQVAQLVGATDIADPPPVTTGTMYFVGPCSMPGADVRSNADAGMLTGQANPFGQYLGRREHSLQVRTQVVNGTFLTYAIRDHVTTPHALGTVNGLRLLTVEHGQDDALTAAVIPATQSLDCLFNSLSLSYDEGQPVEADCELWPMCEVPATAGALVTTTHGEVLTWQHLAATVGGVDVRPLIKRIGVRINNNLVRKGERGILLGTPPAELAISRGATLIRPQREAVEVSFHLYDLPANSSPDRWDWGTIVLTAAHPVGFYAVSQTLTVTVIGSALSEVSRPAARGSTEVMFALTAPATAVSIVAT